MSGPVYPTINAVRIAHLDAAVHFNAYEQKRARNGLHPLVGESKSMMQSAHGAMLVPDGFALPSDLLAGFLANPKTNKAHRVWATPVGFILNALSIVLAPLISLVQAVGAGIFKLIAKTHKDPTVRAEAEKTAKSMAGQAAGVWTKMIPLFAMRMLLGAEFYAAHDLRVV